MHKILITGATGFVGRRLCHLLLKKGYYLRIFLRTEQDLHACEKEYKDNVEQIETVIINDLSDIQDFSPYMHNIQTIIHLAARVHVMNDKENNAELAYHKMNVVVTTLLAKAAVNYNINRFIFISSIKVHGEKTSLIKKITEQDAPAPQGHYAISKYNAEQQLKKITKNSNTDIVILRPPLMYGADVKANFLHLVNAVKKGLPLPIKGVQNKRSMLYVENFIDAILLCISHPNACNQTFVLSDNEALSTPELVTQIGLAINKPSRIFFIPNFLLRYMTKILGQESAYQRLSESFIVDNHKIKTELQWAPPYTLQEALKKDFSKKNQGTTY
ncbi:MAG: NAD-dependent epimerase/dehydratase family protein [Legionellaceae bacterium]|nr:NAD-dependent epimerase/dehydratase family protein [Legionellaceae bacterium]